MGNAWTSGNFQERLNNVVHDSINANSYASHTTSSQWGKTSLAEGKPEVSPNDKMVCSSLPECQSNSGVGVQDEDKVYNDKLACPA